MSNAADYIQYCTPPAIAALGWMAKRVVSSVSAFKRDLERDMKSLHERLGKLENRMVHLEGAVHERFNSGRPVGRY